MRKNLPPFSMNLRSRKESEIPQLPKEIYEYMTNFADDGTILNMLSVNEKFNDPVFFQRVFQRKYPLLIPFKKEYESWRTFFARMTYYIAKLKEDYDIPYFPSKYFNPEKIYKNYVDTIQKFNSGNYKNWDEKARFLGILNSTVSISLRNMAAETGNLSYFVNLLEKVRKESNSNGFEKIIFLDETVVRALTNNHINVAKFLVENGANLDMGSFRGRYKEEILSSIMTPENYFVQWET